MADHAPEITVAITGANGSLGRALLVQWHQQGARLIALTSRAEKLELDDGSGKTIPLQQVEWHVGEEQILAKLLASVDILVINHGINVQAQRTAEATQLSLDVNGLSAWRLLELFATVTSTALASDAKGNRRRPEVWINTSEAEIQPALSPLYEISKRLLGQLISLRALDLSPQLRIRRLVLGPFRSNLNPYGVMDANWVAKQIMRQVNWNWNLVIVTPNPFTYVLMPITSLLRWIYFCRFSRAATPDGGKVNAKRS